MDFKVRAAVLGDAGSIARLSEELGYPIDDAAARERLAAVLGRDDQRVIVAEGREGVCGWLQAHSTTSIESGLRVEIAGLIVGESARRRGVGRALVAVAETWAAEISAETIVVRTNAKRVESQEFYPSLGYLASKTQVVYRKRADI